MAVPHGARTNDDEGVADDLALQHAHDLQVAARLRVHRHLQKRQCRDLHTAGSLKHHLMPVML